MASGIDRNAPVLWPARSLDLNPCDFFLWGHLRQIVYETPVIVFPFIIWFYGSTIVIIRSWGCGFGNRREDIVA
jgi:hypothetical protein